jgi:hypothetical protein
MTIAAGTKYVQSGEADATMAGDRAAIFHKRTKSAITLNPTGTVLWNRLTSPLSAEELVSALRERYPKVGEEQARADVHAFLADLLTHEMLQQAD